MKCVIPGAGIKAFGKAIFCLSKMGEELYIEALEDGLALKTVNTARSAFACFLFERKFFNSYRDRSSGRGSNDDDNELKCKLSTRSILSVFRSLHTLERTVDRCSVTLDLKEDKLVFVFHCRHGVVKTYSLGYQECEALQAVFTKELCPNHISAPAKVLSEVVTHFPSSLEEVTLTALPTSVTLRNYVENDGDGTRPSLTEISLAPEEFDHYQVGLDVSITFCLKELRAILMFTDAINHSLSMRFEEPGRPMVLSIEDGRTYKADFVMATLLDNSHQPSSTTTGTASVSNGLAQNCTNGPDSPNNKASMQLSQNTEQRNSTETETETETRPKKSSTAKSLPKSHSSIRTHPASSAAVDFPSGSQFGHPDNHPTGPNSHVPPPPTDLDFMEIEYAQQTDADQTAGSASTTKGSTVHINKGASRNTSVPKSSSISKSSVESLHLPQSTNDVTPIGVSRNLDTIGEDFDVMDAIFGVENLNDVADEGNTFGFGVERHSKAEKTALEREEHEQVMSMSEVRDMSGGDTQDSTINDSGVLPRSPPAKKHKATSYAALLGLNMFSSEHDRSYVLAPDSDDDET